MATRLPALFAFVLIWCDAPQSWATDQNNLDFFESRIRPVLIEHCYECHSSDAKEVKGGLRVDYAAGISRGGDSGPAIVAGKPDESLLLQSLRFESFEMPPGGRLSESVIKDFEHWIESGAIDPRASEPTSNQAVVDQIDIEKGRQFWSFQPVRGVQPPTTGRPEWSQNPIDAFVLRRLEDAGISPSPGATRQTLLRRIYYDLIGLPPTAEQIQQFNRSNQSIESLTDQLLSSSQFGVHWGRHWLDVARYADSNGGDFNATFHNAWRYRDYIVNSYNLDKPFDQLVREQIAGDLIDFETWQQQRDGIVATGFLMVGAKMLSERDKTKLTMDVIDEQINTIGQAFLGLTLGCARCHDHKFDPIPTEDYYALAGIFKSTRALQGESQKYVSTWPRRALPVSAERKRQFDVYSKEKSDLEQQIKSTEKEISMLKQQRIELDGSALVVDDAKAKMFGTWKSSTFRPGFFGKNYRHDEDKGKGKKRAEFHFDSLRSDVTYDVQVAHVSGGGLATNVPIIIKHHGGETEVTLNQMAQPSIDGQFTSVGEFRFESSAQITISNRDTDGFVIVDAVRLVSTQGSNESTESSRAIRELGNQLMSCKVKLDRLKSRQRTLNDDAPDPLPEAIAVGEAKQIVDCQVCIRGEHANPGEVVPRGTVQVVAPHDVEFSSAESGRRELANWVASEENPLTARVYVNRVWQHLLGKGIVVTPDNFGIQGSRPSHPELLDYLTREFMSDQWSTKRLIRRIVLSRTYQQSCDDRDAPWNIDPENRLLWKANRKSIPAESIRDSIQYIAGSLDLNPAASPVVGLGTLTSQRSAGGRSFDPTLHQNRRSIYLPMIRNEMPDFLTTFDMADPDLVTGLRPVTTVPSQSLLLINKPFVIEQASRTAEKITRGKNVRDLRSAIVEAYQLVFARHPDDQELDFSRAFLCQISNNELSFDSEDVDTESLAKLVHVLFASVEFRTLR